MDSDKIIKASLLYIDNAVVKFDYNLIVKIIVKLGYHCPDKKKLEGYLTTHLILDLMANPDLIYIPISRIIMFKFAAGFAALYKQTMDISYAKASKFYSNKAGAMKNLSDKKIDELNSMLKNVEDLKASRINISYSELDGLINNRVTQIFDRFVNKLK